MFSIRSIGTPTVTAIQFHSLQGNILANSKWKNRVHEPALNLPCMDFSTDLKLLAALRQAIGALLHRKHYLPHRADRAYISCACQNVG